MRKTLPCIWFLLLVVLGARAQSGDLSNLHRKIIATEVDSVLLDSSLIFSRSLVVRNAATGVRLDSSAYRLERLQVLRWRLPPNRRPDSVQVEYRTLPFDLRMPFAHLDSSRLRAGRDSTILGYSYNPFEDEAPLIDFQGLDYNGTFARGLSFGNNQDLVLNSNFNLQLAGDLGEGIEILAAISDENIPLQPEGNTRQLQEFDKVFIQLKKDNNQLIAGDYELQRPDSYFMNYFKKLQGATFRNTSTLGPGQWTTDASLAVARGEFVRNTITGLEGNQGPYKLRGRQGERFIIILSGTEKVWLDGQLMQRGLEEDYIIDYNRGEVTFTNKRLITKDSRIIVEFEYADQNYLRSLYAINSEYRRKNARFYVNLLNQQDSRTSTGNQELSDAEKRILAMADDGRAFVSSIDTLEEFNPVRAMYAAVDTLLPCGRRDTILVYSTRSEALLTAQFSFVGSGNGNYTLDQQQAGNERIYRWVPPDPVTCRSRGDYAPVRQLTAPQQQMLMTAGGDIRFSESAGLHAEIALSNNDINRFSRQPGTNENGIAFFTTFDKLFQLSSGEGGWQLSTDLGYEFVQETFQALNPYRDPEFLRDWSLADKLGGGTVQQAQEHLLRGALQLQRPGWGGIEYRLSSFLRDSFYRGVQHFTRLRMREGGLTIDGQGSFLNSRLPGERRRFLRPRATISHKIPWLGGWELGLYGEMEKSDRYDERTDTLTRNSFYFHLVRSFLRSPERENFRFESNLTRRQDYLPLEEGFQRSSLAHEFNINGSWRWKRALRLSSNFTYRRLEISADTIDRQPGETFLGRTDAGLTLFKGAIRTSTTYEIGSGQEPKLEFTFIRVNKGEGTHIWLDSLYNNDGVVQPNEMEIAPFPDQADFIKVTTFTDQFIQTDFVNFNQSLQLNPKAVWFNAEGWRRLLARFSTQSSLKINRKTQDAPGVSPWNPFQGNIADSALVATRSNIRHVLFFNRADPLYDIQLGIQDNSSKTVQTTGFESRRRQEQFLRTRWNITSTFSTQLSLSQGQRISDSEFFQTKDFEIDFFTLEPQLTFLPSQNFRTILRYKFQRDENTLPGTDASARQHDFNLEATYNRSAASALRLSVSLVNIDFEGRPNSPVGFAILSGLSPGRNYLWNLGLDRQIAGNIQLRLSYEGRKTGTAGVVHVGRAQVAATF